jgi:hypothetical protein
VREADLLRRYHTDARYHAVVDVIAQDRGLPVRVEDLTTAARIFEVLGGIDGQADPLWRPPPPPRRKLPTPEVRAWLASHYRERPR